jgi:hypothetical protein
MALSTRLRDSESLQPVVAPGGSTTYPVVIGLPATDANLRPGMSVRITFSDR